MVRPATLLAPLFAWVLVTQSVLAADPPNSKPFAIPQLDLNDQAERQVVVDRESGKYLGHPTTVLLEDGKTILIVYPQGHGKGAILYKRSTDGGKTWSDRLPTPENWKTSLETPTLYRTIDPAGKKRLIMFSGLYPIRMASSDDDGAHWTELAPIGKYGGIVAMGSVIPLKTGQGHYLAMFHDDGRFFTEKGEKTASRTLYQTLSTDGGLTWGEPRKIYHSTDLFLCEPGAIRSPDGKEIAVLLRENTRKKNSHVIFSRDEGKTWTEPKELPRELTGDRHWGKYTADGRLFISFRDTASNSPTSGDWVGWVGRYEDITSGKPGQYRVRLKDNFNKWDCAYPGVEVLPDDTIVTTTYGHWIEGQPPYILAIRFKLKDVDALLPK